VSDPQDKNIEQLAQETAAAGESMLAAGPDDAEDARSSEPPTAFAHAAEPAPRGSSAPAWIALLLALVVAAGLGWSMWEQQRRDAGITARLQAIEAAGGEVAGLEEMNLRWQRQLDTAVQQLQAGTREMDSQSGQLAQALADLQEQVAEQSTELARYSANDRDAWSLAEAQYLMRLANQRLLMAGDVVAAQALLGSADNILLALDDVRLHEARAAVATDLAALRAVPRIDVEGLYLRLAALVEQAGALVIFQLPEQSAQLQQVPAQDWQGRLRQGYEAALAKLSNYIIIRRRDVPVQALMDPQWEGLVRQNLRMLLEQAQVALLSGNEMLYRESLQRAQHWVGEFFASDEAAARAMSSDITQLLDIDIAARVPDISRSVLALDAVVKQRLQPAGEQ
jgi:uroporphyrin-3 C-methyltransferase